MPAVLPILSFLIPNCFTRSMSATLVKQIQLLVRKFDGLFGRPTLGLGSSAVHPASSLLTCKSWALELLSTSSSSNAWPFYSSFSLYSAFLRSTYSLPVGNMETNRNLIYSKIPSMPLLQVISAGCLWSRAQLIRTLCRTPRPLLRNRKECSSANGARLLK